MLITNSENGGVPDRENSISLRRIDYVQSLIASVPRSGGERDELSDEEWVRLGNAVESLFMEFFCTMLS